METAKLRAWWASKQGLDGTFSDASSSEVLQKTGWARSVGGVGPYLTLFSRNEKTREEIDREVADLQIYELPAARGCTYVVPFSDFALALKAGHGFGEEAAVQTAIKHLGFTEKELLELEKGVLKVLAGGKKDPKELKDQLGDAVRNFGEPGKKKGVTTSLPLALGRLQSQGKIRRVPTNGRLDQQRYSYVLWKPSPLEKSKISKEDVSVELARKYFQWIGPATLKEFQWFSALGVQASKNAIEPLKLVPLEPGSELLLFQEDLETLNSFRVPKDPVYKLVSSLDGLFLLRRELPALLNDKDRERKVFEEKTLRRIGDLKDLPSHAIIDRGRLIGLWEYEPSTSSIVWTSFTAADRKLKEAVARTETFVRDQLGDARSFSLDSPESRAPRIKALRDT